MYRITSPVSGEVHAQTNLRSITLVAHAEVLASAQAVTVFKRYGDQWLEFATVTPEDALVASRRQQWAEVG